MFIGPHISIAKGFYKAGMEAVGIGANTFQFFSRNPRGGKAKDLDVKDIDKLKGLIDEGKIDNILCHGPYTLNLASAKPEVAEFGREMLKNDFERMNKLPCQLYNFHPGSHIGLGVEKGIEAIAEALNEAITGEEDFYILLEAMAGKGTEIGRKFEELASIIDKVEKNEKMGVCIDTCHIYSAGYDIVNDLDGVLDAFDKIVGLERLKAIHLNDSKMPFASNKDRHEIIGQGTIGMEALMNLVNHPRLQGIPLFLETPNNMDGYAEEIKVIREQAI